MSMSGGMSTGSGWVTGMVKTKDDSDEAKRKRAAAQQSTYAQQTAAAGMMAANDMVHMGMQSQQTEGGYAALQAALTRPQADVEPIGMQAV
jgi:hypothetical protein